MTNHYHCANGCEKAVAVQSGERLVCARCGGDWVPCGPEICDLEEPVTNHTEAVSVERARFHVEGQTSTIGPRWQIWDGEKHFARFRHIADQIDANNICDALNARLSQSLQPVDADWAGDWQHDTPSARAEARSTQPVDEMSVEKAALVFLDNWHDWPEDDPKAWWNTLSGDRKLAAISSMRAALSAISTPPKAPLPEGGEELVPSGFTAETWAAKQAEVAEFSRRNPYTDPATGRERVQNSEAKLRAAYATQCSDVPNQFALVRRGDLGNVLHQLTRHRAGHELAIEQRNATPTPPLGEYEGLVERLLKRLETRSAERGPLVNPDGPEAAAAIQSLTLAVAKVREEVIEEAAKCAEANQYTEPKWPWQQNMNIASATIAAAIRSLKAGQSISQLPTDLVTDDNYTRDRAQGGQG